ncbi:hypothetical protein [Actinomycetospora flava]|uniref:Uncharacterized protein n=1 Tax=Actinomycetospora flava TaxID=3129232 RepID=A0ABU8M9F6_9PSEU
MAGFGQEARHAANCIRGVFDTSGNPAFRLVSFRDEIVVPEIPDGGARADLGQARAVDLKAVRRFTEYFGIDLKP